MAFMQRYTQAREAIARIEEMQSQARYREAQIQVQAAEMARKAQEDARKAKLANDLANYTPQPAVAGDMPAPPMGLLRQNPVAMQEIAALQQTIKNNTGLIKIHRENGSDKWIELEEKNAAARTHLTGIYDKFEKQRQDERKEIAEAGLALANAPGQAMFNATWVGLSPETQAYYRQKGLPIDKDGMPIMANGVQQALKSIATTNLTASEQGAIQTEARQAANTAADNERADEAAKRDAIRTKLQQAAGAREAIKFEREQRGELTPAQKEQQQAKLRENAQQDRNTAYQQLDKSQAIINKFESSVHLDNRNSASNMVVQALDEIKKRGSIAPETQRAVRADFLAAINDYRSRYGDTAYRSKEFEDLTSFLGKNAAWLQSVGEGRAIMDNETARKIHRVLELGQQFANAQVAEKYLTVRDQLSTKLDDDENLSKFAKSSELTTTANLQQYVKFLEGKRGKGGEPLTGVLKDGTRWVTLSNGRTVPLPQDE